jgi:hypothetical protein
MTLMVGLHHFFLEMSIKCWPRFRVRNSTSNLSTMNVLPCEQQVLIELAINSADFW